ncbi:MAG: AAA family ATPase [Rhodospirillaceae bacterium]|nr:AAA family ATPase [Rhodospirillaceae bacterium]
MSALTPTEIEEVIFHAAKARGDEEAQKRKEAVSATVAKKAIGEPVYGWPSVAGLLGEAGAWALPALQKLSGASWSSIAKPVLDLVDATAIQLTEPDWLIKDWLVLGGFALLGGNPGDYKSTIIDTFAARISTGMPLWDGIAPIQGNVIIANAEDPAHVVKARLLAADADLSKIKFLHGANAGGLQQMFAIEEHLAALASAVKETGAKFVSLDPLLSYLGLKTNSYSDHQVKWALTPLLKLAEELKFTALGVWHFNKTAGKIALHKGGGSIGFAGTARTVLQVTRNPDDPFQKEYVLSAPKMSHGPKPKGRIFGIETVAVNEGQASCSVGRIKWTGISNFTPDELVAKTEALSAPSELGKAMKFLTDTLSASSAPSSEIFEKAAVLGFSEKTVKRAATELGIQKMKQKGVEHGPWIWSLADKHESPKGPQ